MISYSSEFVAFVCFFVYGSFFEWTLHKYLMHKPLWQYSFRAHALIHHGIFRIGPAYYLSDKQYLAKVRFAWWNAPLILMLHAPAIFWIQSTLKTQVFFGAMTALGIYYLLYEYLHYCMHVPRGRWFENMSWFLWLDAHHHMHHKRYFNNLNVVFPLADVILGTLIPAKQRITPPDRTHGALIVEAMLD